jgi:ABC-type glycerol-3-phosphate transport system permease component
MLDLPAPGVWLSVQPRTPSALYTSLYASAMVLPLSVLAIAQFGVAQRTNLLFWIVIVLLPMLALGTLICLLLLDARVRRLSLMYAADLSGQPSGVHGQLRPLSHAAPFLIR